MINEVLTDDDIVSALVNAGLDLSFRDYDDDIKTARAIERAVVTKLKLKLLQAVHTKASAIIDEACE